MPVSNTGYIERTQQQVVAEMQEKLRIVYNDPNLDLSDGYSQDSLAVNLFALMIAENDAAVAYYFNQLNEDSASGVMLDFLCSLSGIKRNIGTKTKQIVTVTSRSSILLKGGTDEDLFKVTDGVNIYSLETDAVFSGVETKDLTFIADEYGAIQSDAFAINQMSTYKAEIDTVINNSTYVTLGTPYEYDPQLRARLKLSKGITGQNSFEALQAQLLNLQGVRYTRVYFNEETATIDNIPGKSVLCVVDGGEDADIANAIYSNLSGAGTSGDITFPLVGADGYERPINFSRTQPLELFLKFKLNGASGLSSNSENDIKVYLEENVTFDINQPIYQSKVSPFIIDALVALDLTNVGTSEINFSSDGETYATSFTEVTYTTQPTLVANKITIQYD